MSTATTETAFPEGYTPGDLSHEPEKPIPPAEDLTWDDVYALED